MSEALEPTPGQRFYAAAGRYFYAEAAAALELEHTLQETADAMVEAFTQFLPDLDDQVLKVLYKVAHGALVDTMAT